jgi:hypothetical protein
MRIKEEEDASKSAPNSEAMDDRQEGNKTTQVEKPRDLKKQGQPISPKYIKVPLMQIVVLLVAYAVVTRSTDAPAARPTGIHHRYQQ